MTNTINQTKPVEWQRLFETNVVAESFAAIRKPQAAKPVSTESAAVIETPVNGGGVPNSISLTFFGTDAANQTALARVWAWSKEQGDSGLWIPRLLADTTMILGATNFDDDGATSYTVDTLTDIAISYSADGISPTSEMPAHTILDFYGHALIDVELAANNSAASVNGWLCFQT